MFLGDLDCPLNLSVRWRGLFGGSSEEVLRDGGHRGSGGRGGDGDGVSRGICCYGCRCRGRCWRGGERTDGESDCR